jgi:hypothetical protein
VNDSPCVQTDPKARPSAMHVTFAAVAHWQSNLSCSPSAAAPRGYRNRRCCMHVCV